MRNRTTTLLIAALAVFTMAASDFAFARGGGASGGGGGGGGRGSGRGPAPKSGAAGGKSIGGAKQTKDKKKRDDEIARERLRQADYRGRDSGRDRAGA